MNVTAVLGGVVSALLLTTTPDQKEPQQAAPKQPPAAAAPQSAPAQPPTRAELEKALEEKLDSVRLVGTWRMTNEEGLKGKAALSDPKPEAYTILSAHKADGDWWLFKARIEYGEHNVELPLRLQVQWAGDTPIITVDKMTFPGIGVYSARVMFYGNFYAGTWFGDCYGGILSGQITKLEDTPEGDADHDNK